MLRVEIVLKRFVISYLRRTDMGLEKLILNLLLGICRPFVCLLPIQKRKVTFISLTMNTLSGDFKKIVSELEKDNQLKLKYNLVKFEKTLLGKFKYLLNCFTQLYEVCTSHVVIINDNNYVISKFKRNGVKVIQIWHACGAVKKFGNQIERQYHIQNYDYVISCADEWKTAFSQAFGVNQNQVIACGLPRTDALCDSAKVEQYRNTLIKRFPILKDSYVYLYAPTFRGNIIGGFRYETLPLEHMLQQLPENSIIMYKMHPLLGDVNMGSHPRILNMNKENLNALLCIADCLISDYSSVIFDYSIVGRKMIFYVPDLENYKETIGLNVDYENMPGDICESVPSLTESMKKQSTIRDSRLDVFRDVYFKSCDGKNAKRIAQLIHKVAG